MERFFGPFAFFLLISCKFNVSPYVANAPSLKLNEVNLSRIRDEEGGTGANFRVALIADTHNYYKEFEDLIKTINANGPYSFVIVCGDITNLGLLEEYHLARRLLSDLKWPFLVAVGNHDLLSNGQKIFRRMFGKEDFSFEYKDVTFVIVNNNNWEAGGKVPDISIVNDVLVSATTTFKVLVSHVALRDRKRFGLEMVEQWRDMVTNSNVDYVINGHDHNPVDDSFGSAKHLTVGAPVEGSYFELTIGPGGISHQKVSF